jgi:hypothetical protein
MGISVPWQASIYTPWRNGTLGTGRTFRSALHMTDTFNGQNISIYCTIMALSLMYAEYWNCACNCSRCIEDTIKLSKIVLSQVLNPKITKTPYKSILISAKSHPFLKPYWTIYNRLRLTINFGWYRRENTQSLPWQRQMKRFLANISLWGEDKVCNPFGIIRLSLKRICTNRRGAGNRKGKNLILK